jgi:hypothetical protein
MIKLKDILNEVMEMASTDIHYQNILNAFLNSDDNTKKKIAQHVSGQGHMDQAKLEYDLLHLDYEDVIEIERALDINPLEEKKEKPGLWANIRAQRARGEKPARKGSKEYKKAVKAAKEINKNK